MLRGFHAFASTWSPLFNIATRVLRHQFTINNLIKVALSNANRKIFFLRTPTKRGRRRSANYTIHNSPKRPTLERVALQTRAMRCSNRFSTFIRSPLSSHISSEFLFLAFPPALSLFVQFVAWRHVLAASAINI